MELLNYILVAIAGILAGGIANMAIYPERREQSSLQWYVGFFYRNIRYVMIEAATAAVLILLYAVYGATPAMISFGALAVLLITAAGIDIRKQVIPDKLVVAGVVIALGMLFFNDAVTPVGGILGGITAGGLLWLISMVTKGGLGLGDAKLIACTGIFVGVGRIFTAMLLATLLSSLVGLALIVVDAKNRKKMIPFAPFISAGVLLALIL